MHHRGNRGRQGQHRGIAQRFYGSGIFAYERAGDGPPGARATAPPQAREATLLSPNRLMTYGVYVLGVVMLVVGLVFITHGVPIVRMELGWTEIMGGSVAASAGCIVLVLGLLLQHLEAMRDTMERLTLPLPAALPKTGLLRVGFGREDGEPARVEARPIHPLAPSPPRDRLAADGDDVVRPEPALTAALHPAEPEPVPAMEPVAAPPEPEPVLVQSAPALVSAEREEAAHSPAVAAPDPVEEPLAEPPTPPIRANFLAAFLARRGAPPSTEAASAEPVSAPLSFARPAQPAIGRPMLPSRRTSIDLSSGWEEEPREGETRPGPPKAEPAEPPPSHAEPFSALIAHPADPIEVAEDPAPVEPAGTEHQAAPDPIASDGEPDPLQPVVVGRYNAGAASYVMYSNGMIEVETEEGTHQFASMQDLKAFIERRDAQVS